MSKRKLFITTFLITVAVLTTVMYINRPEPGVAAPRLTRISDEIYVTSQLLPKAVPYLEERDVRTVIDVRPDGEAADQPPSAEIEKAAHAANLSFHYIPVPHETIPDSAVQALSSTLETAGKPAVLYCRTGRRAVRLLALAEASRVNGPNLDSILQMVSSAGFSADDLRDTIADRISNRSITKEAKN